MESTIRGQRTTSRRVLAVALLLGALAATLVTVFLSQSSERTVTIREPAAVRMRTVVVAKEEIPLGATIEQSMLERKELPEAAVVAGAATAFDEVAGEVARYPVAKGEQLNVQRLVAKADVQTLSFQIPAGKRGFTISVDVNRSPAALLAPGDFVDVLVAGKLASLNGGGAAPTSTPGAGPDEPKVVVTLLQNVQVLSVQREYVPNGVPYDSTVRGTPPKDAGISYVTLALTPDESQTLWLASQEGKLTLTLRAFGDDKTTNLTPVVEPLRVPR